MDYFKKLKQQYENLWKNIIQPPRQQYSLENLGPEIRILNGCQVIRKDYEIPNKRNEILQCSYFFEEKSYYGKPVVIYLHGNSGSRMESMSTLQILLPEINLFCFDFSGSGKSEGEYVTMGTHEQLDLDIIFEYCINKLKASKIILWGRSMGAVTAILFAAKQQYQNQISCIVLDSPFSDLNEVMVDIACSKTSIPSFVVETIISIVKGQVEEKIGKNIFNIDIKGSIQKIKKPIVFVYADTDKVILPQHTKTLHKLFTEYKEIYNFQGSHNTVRPTALFYNIQNFIYGQIGIKMQDNIQNKNFSELNQPNTFQSPFEVQINQNLMDNTDVMIQKTINNLLKNKSNTVYHGHSQSMNPNQYQFDQPKQKGINLKYNNECHEYQYQDQKIQNSIENICGNFYSQIFITNLKHLILIFYIQISDNQTRQPVQQSNITPFQFKMNKENLKNLVQKNSVRKMTVQPNDLKSIQQKENLKSIDHDRKTFYESQQNDYYRNSSGFYQSQLKSQIDSIQLSQEKYKLKNLNLCSINPSYIDQANNKPQTTSASSSFSTLQSTEFQSKDTKNKASISLVKDLNQSPKLKNKREFFPVRNPIFQSQQSQNNDLKTLDTNKFTQNSVDTSKVANRPTILNQKEQNFATSKLPVNLNFSTIGTREITQNSAFYNGISEHASNNLYKPLFNRNSPIKGNQYKAVGKISMVTNVNRSCDVDYFGNN